MRALLEYTIKPRSKISWDFPTDDEMGAGGGGGGGDWEFLYCLSEFKLTRLILFTTVFAIVKLARANIDLLSCLATHRQIGRQLERERERARKRLNFRTAVPI
jgi:hypothetical protein